MINEHSNMPEFSWTTKLSAGRYLRKIRDGLRQAPEHI
jgi:hypothetical protein